jgi:hypothetical protein
MQVLDKSTRATLPESDWWLLPSEPEPPAAARKAIESAKRRLRRTLESGKIEAIGFHEDRGQRLQISEEAWSPRQTDFATSALMPPYRHSKAAFPPIRGIVVSRDDLLGVFDKGVESKGEGADNKHRDPGEPIAGHVPEKRRGRLPKADWAALEALLEDRINKGGWPDVDNVPGWQCKADVERYIEAFMQDRREDASESVIRHHVTQMLKRIEVPCQSGDHRDPLC